MEPLLERCAGLDVHKQSVVACRIHLDEHGNWQSATRTFGTTTRDLLQLADWLQVVGIKHLAMESTGVYWKPVFNILETQCQVILARLCTLKQYRQGFQ